MLAATFLSMGPLSSAAQMRAKTASGCAAYGSSGRLATVSLQQQEVRFAGVDGKTATYSVAVPSGTTGCKASFSRDARVLAVQFLRPGETSLHFKLLEVEERRWRDAEVRVAPDSIGELKGFVGDTTKLLVISSGKYFPHEDKTTFFPVVVDPVQKKVNTLVTFTRGAGLSQSSYVYDASTGVLWTLDGDYAQRTLRPTKVDEQASSLARSLPVGRCLVNDAFLAFRHEIYSISHDTRGLTLCRVSSGSQQPPSPKPVASISSSVDIPLGTIVQSPDGRFAAVEVKSIEKGRFGVERVSNKIVAVDLETLSLAGELKLNEAPIAVMLAARDREIRIAVQTAAGRWNEHSIERGSGANPLGENAGAL